MTQVPGGRRTTTRTIVLAALLASGVALGGCISPGRFDIETRSRAFDSLWAALDRDFVYLDTAERLDMVRDRYRQEAVDSRTRREYLRALVRFLDHFDDPHLDVYNVADYWRAGGIRPERVCTYVGFAGGRWWIEFTPRAHPADESARTALTEGIRAADDARLCAAGTRGQAGRGAPDSEPVDSYAAGYVFELIDIEGARPSALSVELLAGEPAEVVALSVRCADGRTRTLRMRIPPPQDLPASSQPASAVVITPKRVRDSGVRSRRLSEDVGLIEVTRVNGPDVVDAFDAALDALLDTRALVIDLRRNTGGNTITVERILGRFVDGIRRYGTLQWRTRLVLPLVGDVTTWSSTGMHAWPRKQTYRGPVVVMIDSATMSGGELLAGALRDACGARLVGCATIGAGAGVIRTRLPDGLAVQFGAFPLRRYDGAPIQTLGVRSDTDIPLSPEEVMRAGWRAIEDWRAATLLVAEAEARVMAAWRARRELLHARFWP